MFHIMGVTWVGTKGGGGGCPCNIFLPKNIFLVMSLRGDKYEKHTYFQNFNFFGVNT
jgi:hypothetical protein